MSIVNCQASPSRFFGWNNFELTPVTLLQAAGKESSLEILLLSGQDGDSCRLVFWLYSAISIFLNKDQNPFSAAPC